MSLKDIENSFANAAKAEWAKIVAEGIVIEQKIEVAVKSTFQLLSEQFAPLIMSTISDLATAEFNHLSGLEKTNLAATTVVDHAAQQGISILAQDATALIKTGFEAFKQFAPALELPQQVSDAAASVIDKASEVVTETIDKVAGVIDKASEVVTETIDKVAGEVSDKVHPPGYQSGK